MINWDTCGERKENASVRAFQEQSESSQKRTETASLYSKSSLLAATSRRDS